jgi:hypothetical protein
MKSGCRHFADTNQFRLPEHKVRELVFLFLLGTISLGALLVTGISEGEKSTRRPRISYVMTPQYLRDRQIRESIELSGQSSAIVLVVALPWFLLKGANLLVRTRCSTWSSLAILVLAAFLVGIVWWGSYLVGAHATERLEGWP